MRTVSWTQLSLSLGPSENRIPDASMHTRVCVKTAVITGATAQWASVKCIVYQRAEAEWSSRACFLSGPRSVVTRQYHPKFERLVPCFTYSYTFLSWVKYGITRWAAGRDAFAICKEKSCSSQSATPCSAEEDGESFSWQGQGMGAQYTAGFGPVRLVLKPVHKSVEAVLLWEKNASRLINSSEQAGSLPELTAVPRHITWRTSSEPAARVAAKNRVVRTCWLVPSSCKGIYI